MKFPRLNVKNATDNESISLCQYQDGQQLGAQFFRYDREGYDVQKRSTGIPEKNNTRILYYSPNYSVLQGPPDPIA